MLTHVGGDETVSGGCGKPVQFRREPVAVTGDEAQICATGRNAGKACVVG